MNHDAKPFPTDLHRTATPVTEARIIIPALAGDAAILTHIRTVFCDVAGGYTETQGKGGFVDDHDRTITEPVIIFDVAVSRIHTYTLQRHCAVWAKAMHQQCIYFRRPDGIVELVEPEEAQS